MSKVPNDKDLEMRVIHMVVVRGDLIGVTSAKLTINSNTRTIIDNEGKRQYIPKTTSMTVTALVT